MGGVVNDAVSSIGDIGQGAINAVSDIGVGIDQTVRDTLGPNGWTTAALLAGGYYYAPEIGAYMNAAGSTVPTSAVIDLGATDASLGAAGAANAAAAGAGAGAAVAADNAYLASQALTPAQAAAAAANSVEASQLAGLTGSSLGAQVGTGTSLLGSAVDWAKANPQLALAGAGLAAKALGGSTPTSSTSTTSVDPDIKAAYLRNLEEARTTAAGLGTRQFAPYPEYNLGMVQKYMNPYENTVVQNALADIERQRQGQISQEGALATAAKAFGGSRQGVTRSLVDEAALRNAGNLAAQLRQTGFAQAQNLGLSQQQLQQQYEQQKLDAARNIGLERLNVAQGALSLQPANIGGSTTTPIYQNQTASALGGALGGATLGKLIGGTANPEYAGYGAAAGGLLGFL
jgi:hypothetical protein